MQEYFAKLRGRGQPGHTCKGTRLVSEVTRDKLGTSGDMWMGAGIMLVFLRYTDPGEGKSRERV